MHRCQVFLSLGDFFKTSHSRAGMSNVLITADVIASYPSIPFIFACEPVSHLSSLIVSIAFFFYMSGKEWNMTRTLCFIALQLKTVSNIANILRYITNQDRLFWEIANIFGNIAFLILEYLNIEFSLIFARLLNISSYLSKDNIKYFRLGATIAHFVFCGLKYFLPY